MVKIPWRGNLRTRALCLSGTSDEVLASNPWCLKEDERTVMNTLSEFRKVFLGSSM